MNEVASYNTIALRHARRVNVRPVVLMTSVMAVLLFAVLRAGSLQLATAYAEHIGSTPTANMPHSPKPSTPSTLAGGLISFTELPQSKQPIAPPLQQCAPD